MTAEKSRKTGSIMNTPYPCYNCGQLYVNVLFEDDPTYSAECMAAFYDKEIRWGHQSCPEYIHESKGGWRKENPKLNQQDALVTTPPTLPDDQKWSWENYEYYDSYEDADAARLDAEKTPWPHIRWKVNRLSDGRFSLKRGTKLG